jgi:hypothetical protein
VAKVRIEIHTQNIGGDEELAEALRTILDQLDEGEVEGRFVAPDNHGNEDDENLISWAINPGHTEIESVGRLPRQPAAECAHCGGDGIEPAGISCDAGDGEGEDRPCSVCSS